MNTACCVCGLPVWSWRHGQSKDPVLALDQHDYAHPLNE